MPAIFPELQPEELLYSGIARYSDIMEFPSAQALWRNVYGECPIKVEVDLSGPLGSMVDRMPSGSDYDANSLVRKHTLYQLQEIVMHLRRPTDTRIRSRRRPPHRYRSQASLGRAA